MWLSTQGKIRPGKGLNGSKEAQHLGFLLDVFFLELTFILSHGAWELLWPIFKGSMPSVLNPNIYSWTAAGGGEEFLCHC